MATVVIRTICLFLVATVGFEETIYQVNESTGTVEVCAVVYEPYIDCPIQIDFNVTFNTENETAGRYVHACMYLHVSCDKSCARAI